MISKKQVLEIHKLLIKEFGGSYELRDENLLDAALARPFTGFGEIEFYPEAEDKAAAIFESIIKNHRFVDGNKRIGYVLLRLVLMHYGKDINASADDKYQSLLILPGNLAFEQIVSWIKSKTC